MGQIEKKGIKNDAVHDEQILLDNGDFLRGRNAANSGNINLFKVNSSNVIELGVSMNAGGFEITNAAAPTAAGSLSTKSYVDTAITGVVTSGTISTMESTTGADGQLFWNTTYKHLFRWVTDRWWPEANPDPRRGFVLPHEEFIGTDRIESLDWNTNSGTITFDTGVGNQNPGVLIVRQILTGDFGNLRSSLAHYLLGGMDLYFETLIKIPTLATVGEDFVVTFGLNDKAAYDVNGACTDGAYFALNRAVNGANWITNTTSNGTNTATNTSTAVTAGTFYRLGIKCSATNSNVVFTVNGTVVATHTTNIPTGAGRNTGFQLKLDKIAGSSNSDAYFDYFVAWGFFTGGARST